VIGQKLLALPGRTRVCPGHGKTSTIADETAANPFLKK
jgi:glyoxylase-like metal-dependent hydrolase (beta-lactamase superfamily II)